ncbi:MAG: peptidoglycan D,D-transpeptidase FtsI family protein [bacterium]
MAAIILIAGRLFQLQILHHECHLKRILGRATSGPGAMEPRRGTIYDRQGRELAVSVKVGSVYGVPEQLQQEDRFTLRRVCHILQVKTSTLENKLDSGHNFVWLKRKIVPDIADQLKGLGLEGIGIREESKRYYPDRELAAQVLGFAGLDNHGLEGAELFFDRILREDGQGEGGGDVRSFIHSEEADQTTSPCISEGPYDLFLTIDQVIQYHTEKELFTCCKNMRAKGGMAVVMEVGSGEILAMANYPTYNPNNFSQFPAENWRNRCVTDAFEPGSVFKIFLAATALEEKVLEPNDMLFCEHGVFRIGGRTIHDTHRNGWLSFTNIIKESSNIGSAKIGLMVGKERFYHALMKFGFGAKTGIQLPGENDGVIKPLRKWTDLGTANISFGQGILVTPLQLINATCCLANRGSWRSPKILKAVRDRKKTIMEMPQGPIRRVVSEAACEAAITMLEKIVQSGTGKAAYIPGYRIAGKTGTAQKVDPVSRRYSKECFFSSFVGFFPANEPHIAILVAIDEPQEEHLAGIVAAPVFRRIAQSIIHYLNIPPAEVNEFLKVPALVLAHKTDDDMISMGVKR